ncbi:hypothetical protein D3C83_22640 [compost metagenome]
MIRFPKSGNVEVPDGGVNRRWISVAAAAGLILGLLGGQLVHIVPQNSRRPAPVATAAPSAPIAPAFVPITASIDDGLLGEIENVMEVRIASELRALDDFTPLADQR